MPPDWFDFLGQRVPLDQLSSEDLLIVTDDYLDNYPRHHKNKIALLIEPPLRKPHAYSNIYKNYRDFVKVFSFHKEIVLNLPNAEVCYFGGSAIPVSDWGLYPKTKNTSIIVSHKRDLPGNILRHQIIDAFSDKLDLFGYMNPIPNNFLGLRDYRFNVCIENSKVDWYFTEKICDCFATGTIPVYWGPDTIGDFFNLDGFITFDNLDDLAAILPKLDDYAYNLLRKPMMENYEKVQELGLYDKNILKSFGSVL